MSSIRFSWIQRLRIQFGAGKLVSALALLYLAFLPFKEAYLPVPYLLIITAIACIPWFKANFHREALWPVLIATLLAGPLFISAIFAIEDPWKTFEIGTNLIALGLGAVVLAVRFSGTISESRWLWTPFAVVMIWVFDALLQHFTGSNLLGNPPAGNGRLTGLFYPSIAVGTFVAHFVLLAIEPLRRYTRSALSHLSWLVIIPMMTVIALGGSRAAWITLLLAIMFFIGINFATRELKMRWLIAFFVFVALTATGLYFWSPLFQVRIDRTLGLFSGDWEAVNLATSQRLPSWAAAWQAFIEHWPTGTGLGQFSTYIHINDLPAVRVNYAHLFGADILMKTGIVGAAGYAFACGILVVHCIQAIRNRWDITAVLLASALIAISPLNVHWGFYGIQPVGIMWLFIALGYAFRVREGFTRLPDQGRVS